MKFLKGYIPWNKGSVNLTGRKKGCIAWNKGKRSYKLKLCLICKEQVFPNNQRGYNKTCSDICMKKLMAIKKIGRTGKNSPHWKGGITTMDKLERTKFKRSMQKIILKRDNYTCQLCGVRGVDLQVDHIQSWAEYIELRFNLDNCRTLCAKCHYKITFNRPMPINIKGWGHNLLKEGNSYSI